ncbi:MAG: hypothetical protein IJE09_06230 [Oscillospiraceae bacterium]|nr:hypothetical protein [Oscillospiraceae bacterium]
MTEDVMERIVGKLLNKIEERLDQGALLEPKDYKAVTGALKELRELQRGDGKKDGALVVRFEGEAGECSM